MGLNIPNFDLNSLDLFDLLKPEQIVQDYRMAYRSRQISLLGRQEVLSGRAKFGIFGDGKEVPQIALAHAFDKGDFRSGYYRDQTIMLALGEITVRTFFAQLYAHADLEHEPASGGRMMNAHFVTRSLNPDGSWRDLTAQHNTAADISPTAGQMPRLVGLAYASRLYRDIDELKDLTTFSKNGNEVAFGTIGNASTAEGMFWETINAIGVLRSPAIISIWDDDYGISVTNDHAMVKQDLSALLSGFQREGDSNGFDIYTVPAWDFAALVKAYYHAAQTARANHIPAIIHVTEVTQPQGHSTSGSHERYKSEERLEWEKQYDCLIQMREWMIREGVTSERYLDKLEVEESQYVRNEQRAAWKAFVASITGDRDEVKEVIEEIASYAQEADKLAEVVTRITRPRYPKRKDILEAIFETLKLTRNEPNLPGRETLITWREQKLKDYQRLFSTHVYSESDGSPRRVQTIAPQYNTDAPIVNGFEVLNTYFDDMFARDPRVIAFGEDVGYLGGVNQTMAGLQAKYGDLRVSDTGIRETTILGQAIGMALRGLRPIAEIQYLDYILYAIQTMSDDLATLHWRTAGGQKAPVIIRTRGHRLEGIWHSGSLMGSILNMVRGVNVLVPRDMVRAVGFYNTLLQGDDPGLVVEVLNGYRKKERLPDNLNEMTVPLGVPETLREGHDVTLVTYGAMCGIAMQTAKILAEVGVEVEVIDVQSLLPFDVNGQIVESLKKTNRIIVVDEDVPGGTTAYMLQQVLEVQGGYHWLDSQPRTLSGQEHRPAYGTDGDYFSKPNKETIFEVIYDMMNEADPEQYPLFFGKPNV
jgi:2-oxoisovalerate dehydrogenase E1 component